MEDESFLATPNDPWKDTFQGITGVDWDEESPNGLNWGLETIQAPSAWDYNDRFHKIKIGVVDNGFDWDHQDLTISILNSAEANKENHGTHTSGIIGATANNGTGITGIVWNKTLYGVDVALGKDKEAEKKKHTSVTSCYAGLEMALRNGCKVVNFSIGKDLSNNQNDIFEDGYITTLYLLKWFDELNRRNFIICMSAGNDSHNCNRAGYFASISEDDFDGYRERFINDGGDASFFVDSFDEISNNFIIVAAVDKPKSGNYKLTDFSNYGDNVSIAAPGREIFSTIVTGGLDGSYGNMGGTSMASPIVAGVTSLV